MDKICDLIYKEIAERFNKEPLDIENLEFSDNFAEILEKLIILHIRVWKMEDAIGVAETDKEIVELKKKIDFCFKSKRPKLLKCINLMMDDYITNNKKFKEENIKEYKGFKQ